MCSSLQSVPQVDLGLLPAFLELPERIFMRFCFNFPSLITHRYNSPQHSSACLVYVCLCIKTLLAFQGQAWEWPWTDPNPSPFSGKFRFLCKLSAISEISGWLQLPADPTSKLAFFGHLRPSESHQLCFCWASRLTTDFCIILLLIHPRSSLSIPSKIKFQPLIPVFKYQKRILKASGRCFPSTQPFPAGTTSH